MAACRLGGEQQKKTNRTHMNMSSTFPSTNTILKKMSKVLTTTVETVSVLNMCMWGCSQHTPSMTTASWDWSKKLQRVLILIWHK